MRYKLDMRRDVDADEPGVFILNLPYGFRFEDSHEENPEHVRGFDTVAEVRKAAQNDVTTCACRECTANAKTHHDLP
jgi:23S rRNA G2445 N2-methylase RlmL